MHFSLPFTQGLKKNDSPCIATNPCDLSSHHGALWIYLPQGRPGTRLVHFGQPESLLVLIIGFHQVIHWSGHLVLFYIVGLLCVCICLCIYMCMLMGFICACRYVCSVYMCMWRSDQSYTIWHCPLVFEMGSFTANQGRLAPQ